MKVTLLNPPFLPRFSREQRSPAVTKSGTFYYPMWLAYAAGVLEKEGFECQLIDAVAENTDVDETARKIISHDPKLIVITTSTPSIYSDVKVAERIKNSLPDAVIVLVGPHVSALPAESLELSKSINAVAVGEYDYIVRDLAKVINSGTPWNGVSGLVWRNINNGKIVLNNKAVLPNDLNAIPFVSGVYKKHLNVKDYRYSSCRYPVVSLVTSRGCPNRCVFCSYAQNFSNRQVRFRTPANVIEEIKYIKSEMPEVKEIMLEDDTFTLDKQRVVKICQMMIKDKIKISWSANARADVDYDLLALMKKAGLRLLCVGFESGDQQILNNIKKGITLNQIFKFRKAAKKARVLVHGCFMFGHPGDTPETMKKTLELAKELNPDSAQFFPVMAYPGTEFYRWAEDNGYLETNNFRSWITPEGLHSCVVSAPGMSARQLSDYADIARRGFYLSPRYLTSKLWQIARNPGELSRNMKAFFNLIKHL